MILITKIRYEIIDICTSFFLFYLINIKFNRVVFLLYYMCIKSNKIMNNEASFPTLILFALLYSKNATHMCLESTHSLSLSYFLTLCIFLSPSLLRWKLLVANARARVWVPRFHSLSLSTLLEVSFPKPYYSVVFLDVSQVLDKVWHHRPEESVLVNTTNCHIYQWHGHTTTFHKPR